MSTVFQSAAPFTAPALAAILSASSPTDAVGIGVTSLVVPFVNPFDIRAYSPSGINVMDGASHVLSSAFPTLGAAQAFFGFDVSGNQIAQTLATDEIAFCAASKATMAAKTAGGGTVSIPNGICLMGNRTWVMPDSPTGDDANNAVKVKGAGKRSATLRWQTDTSGVAYAMACATRHTYSRVEIEDLTIYGPGNGAVALGQSPCNMRGLAYSASWTARRCYIEAFYAAICIHDDHTVTEDCTLGRGCYYGVYFDTQTFGTDDLGDHHFLRTSIGFTKRAAFGVSGSNQMEHCLIEDCHLYGNPYCYWREGGATQYAFITNTTVIKLQAEATGNAIFGFADAGNGKDTVSQNTFTDIQFLSSSDYKIAAENAGAATGGFFSNNTFIGPNTQFGSGGNYGAATAALWAVKQFQSNTFIGSGWFNMINNASPSKPLMTGDTIVFNRVIGSEQCDYEIVQLTGAIAQFDVVAWSGLGAGPMGSNSSPLGVAAVAGNSGQAIGVVTKGPTAVNKVTGAITANTRVALDGTTYNKVGQATNASTRSIIGTAWNGAASGDTTANVLVRITDKVA